MEVIRENHEYTLDSFEAGGRVQTLQFIQKEPGPGGVLRTVYNGTTNEEVLRVLIDRMKGLNKKLPCSESAQVITKLDEALFLLERRTADRKARGVEGKALP